GVDVFRQHRPILESARPTGAGPEEPGPLPLLELAADTQLSARDVHIDVFPADPRQLHLYVVGVVGFGDVSQWRPAQTPVVETGSTERSRDELGHLAVESADLPSRIPRSPVMGSTRNGQRHGTSPPVHTVCRRAAPHRRRPSRTTPRTQRLFRKLSVPHSTSIRAAQTATDAAWR